VTGDEAREAAVALLRRTRGAQGLPERVTDEVALSQVAQIIVTSGPVARSRHTRSEVS
jgi:hypothetical protein